MVETLEADLRLTAKGRAMRERMIEAAAELIFAAGARETTLDQVRAAVGASKSQVYHYFADKDELLRAVIEHQGARILQAQQPELDGIDDIASLRRWRDKLVMLSDSHGRIGGCPIGSLANELAGHSEDHRCALSEQFDRWARRIESGLLRMQASGHLARPLDTRALSFSFLAAIQGGLLLAKLQRSSLALAAGLDEIIQSIEQDCGQPTPGR